ncbi:hypothetical protein MSPP1_000677 [Malassezia sp. CBS 17886]|nr:hypothetical protein MSPP1_000677 [Malassezia sp. CBS 17886]
MNGTQATPSATPIIVWCHPRSCSTAFERAFLQRQDTKVWHEPMGDPFYFGDERACHRYSTEKCNAHGHCESTIESVARSLLESALPADGPPFRYVFIKDMAQYCFPQAALHELHPTSRVFPAPAEHGAVSQDPLANPTVLPTALLRRFKHTFLIRTPEKSIPSYWKCVQEKAAGFDFFDAAESGYVELQRLYEWIANPASAFHTDDTDDPAYARWPVQSQPMPPPLVDASCLLKDPSHVVEQYCKAVGVPFDPSMLSWKPGSVDIWEKWGSYHAAAQNSTGFRQDNNAAKEKRIDAPRPAEVQAAIAASLPAYESLKKQCTIHA